MSLGSNIINDCTGVVLFQKLNGGFEELFKLEKNMKQLLLTTKIKDPNNNTIAWIRRNSMNIVSEEYKLQPGLDFIHEPSFQILNKHTDEEIFFAEINVRDVVKIRGVFYIHNHKIVIDDEKVIIDDSLNLKDSKISGGTAIILKESGGLAIGGPEIRKDYCVSCGDKHYCTIIKNLPYCKHCVP